MSKIPSIVVRLGLKESLIQDTRSGTEDGGKFGIYISMGGFARDLGGKKSSFPGASEVPAKGEARGTGIALTLSLSDHQPGPLLLNHSLVRKSE